MRSSSRAADALRLPELARRSELAGTGQRIDALTAEVRSGEVHHSHDREVVTDEVTRLRAELDTVRHELAPSGPNSHPTTARGTSRHSRPGSFR